MKEEWRTIKEAPDYVVSMDSDLTRSYSLPVYRDDMELEMTYAKSKWRLHGWEHIVISKVIAGKKVVRSGDVAHRFAEFW